MTLIKSISGIRGTIGGNSNDTLNPIDIVKFTAAYATFIKSTHPASNQIVVGRDARISGPMVVKIVCGTLMGMGFDVLNIGLATTPTTELAVILSKSAGGIIITASHNPRQWNALKLLNASGEFLSKEEGTKVNELADDSHFEFAEVDNLGHYKEDNSFNHQHVEKVLGLQLVNAELIGKRHFKVIADTINSVGSLILPELFKALGVEYTLLNGTPDGQFAHNPEPLERNLSGIMSEMASGNYDLGIVVDPDVDRLAFISEDGTMFGEEYTLVSVADYVLSHTPGTTVSNLSSSRALRDVTRKHGCEYYASAVGEVNVTTLMKKVNAVIGGEGNGGVIYPECHYGRDALVGIALFLTNLAQKNIKVSELRKTYPQYFMAKNRLDLTPNTDVDALLLKIKDKYAGQNDVEITDIDGVKLDFADYWVHLRKSNTEPIIRVYSEAKTQQAADNAGRRLIEEIKQYL